MAPIHFWSSGAVCHRPQHVAAAAATAAAAGAAAAAAVYPMWWLKIIINSLWLNFKTRQGAIVENVVSYVYAKFDDDWWRNDQGVATGGISGIYSIPKSLQVNF